MRGWLVLVLILVAACTDETRAFIELDASDGVREEAGRARVRVCNEEASVVLDETYGGGGTLEWPFRIELTPRDGDPTRIYWALAETFSGADAFMEERLLSSSYEAGETLVHPLVFDGSCSGAGPCPPGHSCERGACVDARRPPLGFGSPPLVAPAPCASSRSIACDGIDGVLFCDGFEGADPLTDPWVPSLDGGVLDIEATGVFAGMQAARASATADGDEARLSARIDSTGATQLHARGWFLVEEGGGFTHVEVLRLEENSPRRAFGVRVLSGGDLELIERDETRNEAIATPLSVPFGEWFCLTTSIQIAADGVFSVSVRDGSFDVTGIDTTFTEGYDRAGAGIIFSADGGSVVWVDEVTVASEPLSCP